MIEDWNDPKYCLEEVRENPLNLEFVINQTPEICLEAVKQNGLALRFVKNQTPEICLEAVKSDGYAIAFVMNQTPAIIHHLKKCNMQLYESFKKENRITIPDNEMEKFYNENPHLLLTL